MSHTFDPTEMRRTSYGFPCVVCGQPVTWRGTWVVVTDGNATSLFGPYCPFHRRKPTDDTETVQTITESTDAAIALLAIPEIGEAITRAVDTFIRQQAARKKG